MGDFVGGVLVGVGAVAILGGIVTPMLAAVLGRNVKRAAALLLLASVGVSAYGASSIVDQVSVQLALGAV
jgi:hypothetical protein